jgi:hypothetical protein
MRSERLQAYLGYCVSPSNYVTLPQDTSLIDRVEKSIWTSLAWWRPLHNSVDNGNVLFLEAKLEATSHASARALSSTNNSCRAARFSLFKTRG